MITPARYPVILGLTITVVFCGFSGVCGTETTQNDCLSCHEKVYRKGISGSYQHPPFERKECGGCHLKPGGGDVPVEGRGAFVADITERILLSAPDYLEEHTILLRGLIPQATYDISVIMKDMSGNASTKKFSGVIPAKVQDVKRDDGKPPVISGIKVGPMKKGIFLETTITWNTDEPSTSCVEYGLSDQYGQASPEGNALVKRHRASLYELERGKGYHFRIISRDMFGNQALSEDFVFNTAEMPWASDVDETGDTKQASVELAAKKACVFLFGSGLGLYLEATRPTRVIIEYVKVKAAVPVAEAEGPAPTSTGVLKSVITKHGPMTAEKGLAIDACYRCHPPEVLGVSHPVGVAPKDQTNIPDNLPTLEGGIITCVTCHHPHGGSREYLAREETTKDICITCHKTY